MVLLERSSNLDIIMSRYELYQGGLVHFGKVSNSDVFLYVKQNTDGVYALHRTTTKPKENICTPIVTESHILKKDNPLL